MIGCFECKITLQKEKLEDVLQIKYQHLDLIF